MFARPLAVLAIASAAVLAVPSIARADMPPEPCEGAEVGDLCTTDNLGEGTCQDRGGSLQCVEGGATTAAATTAAATTAASTGSGSTSGGEGGGEEGSGGSAGGETDDEGCSVRAPRGKHTTHVGAAAVFALASAIALARRVRRR